MKTKNKFTVSVKIFSSKDFYDGSGLFCDSLKTNTFLQSKFWTSFKESHGWKAFHFVAKISSSDKSQFNDDFLCKNDGINKEKEIVLPFVILVRSFKKLFSIAYSALAPNLDFLKNPYESSSDFLKELSEAIKPFLPKNTLFIRFDPPLNTEGEANFPPLLHKPAKKASAAVQPPDSVILNIEPDCDTLLSAMKAKWRYNIKLAEKKGVEVSVNGIEALDRFYLLYKQTSDRDGIALHAKSYYEDLLLRAKDASNSADVRLYLASHEGTDLAGIITIFLADEAVYLYGASSNEKRNLMPAYALQWQAIKDAKLAGCKRYDFYGIPPCDDPSHPMYGLYRFKTGFGGTIIHRVGSWDIPIKPFLYSGFRFLEKLRAIWFKRVKKIFVQKKEK